ncbi:MULTISPECIES: hypothetical protein [unclassified Phyllobacterium]|uniref:hypothetical protein n=1 Tax=unclassified Phyllobacterium TaxID=2638441 RepID=UPI0030130A59
MIDAATHNAIVFFMMDLDSSHFQDSSKLLETVCAKFPKVTIKDLERAYIDLRSRIDEQERVDQITAELLEPFMPMFEGEDESEGVFEIAKRKASEGNDMAIRFLATFEALE